MSHARRVAKNTGILYVRMAITVFISLYTTRIVLQALGIEDFGIYSLAGGSVAMLTFLNGSLSSATQRFMSYSLGQGEKQRLHQIFNVSLVLHTSIALLTLLLLEGIGYLLFDRIFNIKTERQQAAWLVYQFAVLSTFFTILTVPYDAVINARENMLWFAVMGVVESILKLIVALIVFDTPNDKLRLFALLMAGTTIILLLIRVTYCHSKYTECTIALRRYFNKPLLKEMSAFAGWSLLGTFSSMIANYGQAPLLNAFFGTKVNAAQGLVAQISGQLGVLANVMLRAVNPLIAKSEGAGNRNLMIKASIFSSKMGFFLLTIVYVPVMTELPYLFKLWLDQVPEYAIAFCYLLMIRNLIEQCYIPLMSSISAVGDIRLFQTIHSAIALAPLLISYLLFLWGFGPEALYAVFIAYSCITFCTTVFFAKRVCQLPVRDYIFNVIVRCILSVCAIAISAIIPTLLMTQGLTRLLTVCFLSLSASIASIWFIGFTKNERISIKFVALNNKPEAQIS